MKTRHSVLLYFLASVSFFHLAIMEHHDGILSLQHNVEQLIERVLQIVHNFYRELKANNKCIPEEIPSGIMDILKDSIDCVDANEKEHYGFNVNRRNHQRSFLNCFNVAKKEVHALIANIDPERDYCPENMTEKTYEINITTSYTKRFMINIKNGLEVSKVIETSHPEHQLCLDNDSEDPEYHDQSTDLIDYYEAENEDKKYKAVEGKKEKERKSSKNQNFNEDGINHSVYSIANEPNNDYNIHEESEYNYGKDKSYHIPNLKNGKFLKRMNEAAESSEKFEDFGPRKAPEAEGMSPLSLVVPMHGSQ